MGVCVLCVCVSVCVFVTLCVYDHFAKRLVFTFQEYLNMRTIFNVALLVSAVVCSSSAPVQIEACSRYCEYIESIGTTHELPVFMCECRHRHRHAMDVFGDAVEVIRRPAVQVPATRTRAYIAENVALEGSFQQNLAQSEDTPIAYPVFAESDMADIPVAYVELVTRRNRAFRRKPKTFRRGFKRGSEVSFFPISQNSTPPPPTAA